MRGSVESFEFLGEFVRYEVKVGERRVIADVSHARGGTPLSPGTNVVLGVPTAELRFIRD